MRPRWFGALLELAALIVATAGITAAAPQPTMPGPVYGGTISLAWSSDMLSAVYAALAG